MTATPKRPATIRDLPPRRHVGRPPLTDRAALLDAAVDIGFPAATVGAVTTAVGVKYSTFYRHFVSLDALHAAMVDAILDRATWPADGLAWRPHLEQLAAMLVVLMEEHPGLAEQLGRMPSPPERIQAERDRAAFVLSSAARGALASVDAVILAATQPPAVDAGDEQRLDGQALVPLVLDGIALRIGGGR